MSFSSHPVPVHSNITDTIKHIKKVNTDVFLVILRNTSKNLLIFEALRNSSGKITKIDRYWIMHDPKCITKRRSRGICHDREELSVMERSLYALKTKRENDDIILNFSIATSDPMTLKQNSECIIRDYISADYIELIFGSKSKIIPKILQVDIFGHNIHTKEPCKETVKAPSLKDQIRIRANKGLH